MPVRDGLVGVDGRPGGRLTDDESMQGPPVSGLYYAGADALGGAVPDAGDNGLADVAPAGAELLPRVLVLLQAAHVGLVYLDGAGEWRGIADAHRPCLAEAMEHEPSGGLLHADGAVR